MSFMSLAAAGIAVAVLVGGSSGGRTTLAQQRAEGKIAFSCAGDVCVMNGDGSGGQRLTHDKFVDLYPAWSPDGRRVAFTGYLNRTVIEVINADGSGRRRLTPRHEADALATWSPDGTTLAFDHNTSGTIFLMNADGSGRRPLTHRSSSLPTWSPDGKMIAFVSANGRRLALTSGDIFVVEADGSGERLLARDGTFPAWSPDGAEIAFARNRRGTTDAAIWIISADGSGQRRLWPHSAQGGALAWSPDGTSIAFTFDDDLYAVDRDGRRLRQLTRRGVNFNPAWQRQGRP